MIIRRRCTVVSLGAIILIFLMGVPAGAATLQPNRIDVQYVPPKSSAHDLLGTSNNDDFFVGSIVSAAGR